jgi:putative flippase GtrA
MLRLTKSAMVGIAATLADLAALVLLCEALSLAPQVANVPALLAGVLVQFLGNKLFAFRDRSRAWLSQGLRFAAVEAGAFLLNALAFHFLAFAMPYWAARLVGTALVYFLYSYPLWGLVFTGEES